MRVEELERELRGGRLRPAYLLLGEEPLLQEQAFGAIGRAVLGEGPVDFNFDRLEGATATPTALLGALRTVPVGAARRLVWLREPSGRRPAARELLAALPAAVREAEAASSVLVIRSPEAPARAAWVKPFQELGTVVDCHAPRGSRALVRFVVGEAKRQKIELQEGAAEALVERIGPQLLALRQELAKTALLAGEDARVSRAHVAQSVGDVAEEPIWDLTDAIGEGRMGDALSRLAKLRTSGVPTPVVLGSLAAHFRRLLRLRSGGSVGGPSFVARKLESQARRYPPTRLLACLDAVHQTDEILKGRGNLDADLALERLVLGLAS